MPAKIQDEFTELSGTVSRERLRQLRKMARGLCKTAGCEEPLATKDQCLSHAVRWREKQRRQKGHKRRNRSLSYRLETNGG